MDMTILTLTVTLLFVMNPFGFIPITIKLLAPYPPKRQTLIITREMLFALAIMLLFAFFGSYILEALGISTDAVTIGGGVVIFLIAMTLIFPHHLTFQDVDQDSDPFIFPIATPMVAGGGTIATLMLYSAHITSHWDLLWGILIAWLLTSSVYFLAPILGRALSKGVLRGIEKLMGLVLILMSAQMLLSGTMDFIKNYLPRQNLAKTAVKTSSDTSSPTTVPNE